MYERLTYVSLLQLIENDVAVDCGCIFLVYGDWSYRLLMSAFHLRCKVKRSLVIDLCLLLLSTRSLLMSMFADGRVFSNGASGTVFLSSGTRAFSP